MLREENPKAAENLESQLEGLIQRFGDRILDIDIGIAGTWGFMDCKERKAEIDGAIAATAKSRGFYVVTRNVKHFKKRKVKVLNPSSAQPQVINP